VRVAVVDCGSGNLASVTRALACVAEREGIDISIDVTDEPADIAAADRIVLPGQGAFATCAHGIAAAPGLRQSLESAVEAGTPFLGICVGMQLMAQRGLEHSVTEGLGWITGDIAPLEAPGLRLPQMGWNALDFAPGAHPLLDGLTPGDHVYFVHSYGLRGYDAADLIATTSYGREVPALVAKGNRAGTQFHVEKSQEVGLRILANFLRWSPAS
jgi:glutamine amidotransferase